MVVSPRKQYSPPLNVREHPDTIFVVPIVMRPPFTVTASLGSAASPAVCRAEAERKPPSETRMALPLRRYCRRLDTLTYPPSTFRYVLFQCNVRNVR